jgi:hypothetical protein
VPVQHIGHPFESAIHLDSGPSWSFVHFRVSVCVTRVFLHGRVFSPTINPQPRGPVVALCLTPSSKPLWHGWNCLKHSESDSSAQFNYTPLMKLGGILFYTRPCVCACMPPIICRENRWDYFTEIWCEEDTYFRNSTFSGLQAPAGHLENQAGWWLSTISCPLCNSFREICMGDVSGDKGVSRCRIALI